MELMKLFSFAFLTVFMALFSVQAFAEMRLVVHYDEAYQGTVSVNGQKIGTLMSHGGYNEVTELRKAAKKSGEKFNKSAAFKERTQADKSGLDGVGTNTMMNFRVEYVLDQYLKDGENSVTVSLSLIHI